MTASTPDKIDRIAPLLAKFIHRNNINAKVPLLLRSLRQSLDDNYGVLLVDNEENPTAFLSGMIKGEGVENDPPIFLAVEAWADTREEIETLVKKASEIAKDRGCISFIIDEDYPLTLLSNEDFHPCRSKILL